MANATPHVGQVYRDNNGKGHRLARIIAIRNGRVFLERGRTRVAAM